MSRYPKVSLAAVNVESAYDAVRDARGSNRIGTRDPFLACCIYVPSLLHLDAATTDAGEYVLAVQEDRTRIGEREPAGRDRPQHGGGVHDDRIPARPGEDTEAVRLAAGLVHGRHDRTPGHARRPLTVDLRLL